MDAFTEHILSDKGFYIPDIELEQAKQRREALERRMKEIDNRPPMPVEVIKAAFAAGVNPFGL